MGQRDKDVATSLCKSGMHAGLRPVPDKNRETVLRASRDKLRTVVVFSVTTLHFGWSNPGKGA